MSKPCRIPWKDDLKRRLNRQCFSSQCGHVGPHRFKPTPERPNIWGQVTCARCGSHVDWVRTPPRSERWAWAIYNHAAKVAAQPNTVQP